MTIPAPRTIPAFRPPMCPQCGYSFEGLPNEGACPECGLHYGPDRIILFAWGNLASSAKSPALLVSVCAGTGCVLALLVVDFLFSDRDFISLVFRERSYAFLFFLLASLGPLIALLAMAIWRRNRNLRTMPAPVQIRLSAEGYAIREGLGTAKLRPWKPTTCFTLRRKKNGSPEFVFHARRRWAMDIPLQPIVPPETAAWIASRAQSWIAAASRT